MKYGVFTDNFISEILWICVYQYSFICTFRIHFVAVFTNNDESYNGVHYIPAIGSLLNPWRAPWRGTVRNY